MRTKLALLTAIVAATASLTTGAAAAHTAPPGNTVLAGDSLVANPVPFDVVRNNMPLSSDSATDMSSSSSAMSGSSKDIITTGVGCVTDGAIANEIRQASGVARVDQYQCSGASLASGEPRIDDTLRTATEQADLTRSTKNVVIVAGANDTYRYGLDTQAVDHAVRSGLQNAIDVIHEHAPNAKIVVVGYPRVTSDGTTCANSGLHSSDPLPIPTPLIAATEQRLQNNLREVAEHNGATFVDAWPASAGHDMCSPQRWWRNLFDVAPPAPGNIPLHLNALGIHGYGQLIGQHLH
ncbi:GDSL-type esterase/lipase family protein [Corynebacterium sp. MSK297]|uniref:GDSL-type esterase/lipase family protein n=1 Tax=Corynebacterium sp. MSK297 TaxID=3050221 RepID=UPI00254F8296|nr:GDSL-type esterase/lipase family protein [Corynebacterium sp. MSK297]MDK8846756.1 GDSL-type esterase/lipase family protein [Corynebacterium sp. MSK297]